MGADSDSGSDSDSDSDSCAAGLIAKADVAL